MEAVHVNGKGMKELVAEAKALEAAGDTKSTIKIYTKLSRSRPSDIEIYHRLAILYRKEKDYGGEMQVIDKALAALQQIYTCTAEANSTVKKISARINKAFGMLTEKVTHYLTRNLSSNGNGGRISLVLLINTV